MASPPTSSTPVPKVSLIASIPALGNFLATIGPPSSLYLDLEGTNLGRHGTLDLITVLVPPDQQVRIIDVKNLGTQAFTTPSKENGSITLKSILENPSIRKYLWDVRNDADALKWLHKIAISGVIDLQLLENLTRSGDSFCVTGLEKAIENDLQLSHQEKTDWAKTKGDVRKRMSSGASGIFSARPLSTTIRPAYTAEWLTHLEKASARRVKKACSRVGYKGNTLGPWGANPAYFFKTGTHLSPRADLTAFRGTGRQLTHRGLGSTLISKLVSLMRRIMR
ncbi:hypothetical protein B0T21DRAFT_384863 [Apiosordaria backusii]|uniref:3'-5' exonuclease domain-containing protein n=1 Tax=Apiosordaria backusii TaxID=314023 RepID=A0AA40BEV3_9PEZI|nr:hypothetical protein B0T21DRAFT_384863 [Apiosordaria backusii]